MTALMTNRPDPFTDAVCREPARLPRWWDADAKTDERKLAADLCGMCPAMSACEDAAAVPGQGASGTWAGEYRPWEQFTHNVDDEALLEFNAIFGPSAVHNDNPPPTVASQEAKPVRYGRYWLHPAQLRLDIREAN